MQSFEAVVEQIVKKDSRYAAGAYFFLHEALEFTIKNLKPENIVIEGTNVPGEKLLEGIREYALFQYGPLTLSVFNRWNLKKCEDFGHIVFNLVDYGILSKTDSDSIEDFKNGYDFYEAFQKPFLPQNFPNAN